MSNIDNRLFRCSARTSCSPASTPQPCQPAADDPLRALDSSEITRWMNTMEQHLSEICQISTEGKLNSEQKLKISSLTRKVGNGVGQMAVFYESLKQQAIAVNISMEALKEKQDLAEYLTSFERSIKEKIEESCNKPVVEKVSFADMVKTKKNNFVRPQPLSSIAIYPTDILKTSDDTKSLVQKLICPEKMNLQVRGLRRTKNGGVVISTETKDDIEKLKKSTQLTKSGLLLEEPRKRRPRIVVVGVPSDLQDQEVFNCIFEQNIANKLPDLSRDSFTSSIKLSHKSGKKLAPTCNFVLEVTASIRKALINQERVYINWTSCPVHDFTLVTRCYKCQQYGHAAKTCRELIKMCGHCAGLGHLTSDCTKKAESPKCATCSRYSKPNDHKTGDLECPAKKMAETRYINSIAYS